MYERQRRTRFVSRLYRENREGRLDPECADGDDLPERPRFRSECVNGPRPCPWVGCRYHLWLEVRPNRPTFNVMNCEPWDMPERASCSLDVAQWVHESRFCEDALVLQRIGDVLGLSRQRVHQIVDEAMDHYFLAMGEGVVGL